MMRLVIVGQKLFGAEVLRLALGRGHQVAWVVGPEKAGDGVAVDRMRGVALWEGIAWAPVIAAEAMPADVDLIVCAHAHDFVGADVRGMARLGAIGYHPSLLPLHRGRDAVRWAIHMRERVTGGSVYWLDETADGGDIAAQRHAIILPGETAEQLWRRSLFPIGLELIGEVLADLEAGRVVRVPQDHQAATWEPAFERPKLRAIRARCAIVGEGADRS